MHLHLRGLQGRRLPTKIQRFRYCVEGLLFQHRSTHHRRTPIHTTGLFVSSRQEISRSCSIQRTSKYIRSLHTHSSAVWSRRSTALEGIGNQTGYSPLNHKHTMANKLPHLPDVEKLSTSVIRVMGGNPNKFTLQGSNTYILGTGPTRLLLDTAQGIEAWKTNLSRAITDENITISTCLLSHWHGDHIGGVSDLQSVSPETSLWKAYGNTIDPDKRLTDLKIHIIEDGMKFSDKNGFEVEALHCPGHTKDHMAFIVTKSTDASEVGAMFTVDNVLGHGTAVFEDLAIYLKSLHLMKSRLYGKARAYPGHGVVIEDASAKIQEYIEHRKVREDEALNVLKYGAAKKPELGREVVPGKEWGSMEMVKVIYWDVPEHLHAPAENGLKMVLAKLKGEGRIVESNGKWKLGEKAAL